MDTDPGPNADKRKLVAGEVSPVNHLTAIAS
jgi:hypothetical protein